LPGPKAQIDAQHDRGPDEVKEYVRLFERFQRLRPDDSPEEIEKLITLVENGTLKEEAGNFVVKTSEDDLEMQSFGTHLWYVCADLGCDWEPSSHNTARIQIDEFEDGYFSVPGMTQHKGPGDDVPRVKINASRNCAHPLSKSPLPWLHDTRSIHLGYKYSPCFLPPNTFSDFEQTFGYSSSFHEDFGMKYF
jgi:hypothetical protein